MKESELANFFTTYFEKNGYEVFSEVRAASTIDFVAKKDNITVGVEVKMTLNFAVLGQAYYNRNHFDYIYVAVPYKKRDFSFEICKHYGFGLLLYHGRMGVYEAIEPKLNEDPKHKGKVKLKEYHKLSVAGSQNDRMTEYKWTIMLITNFLKENDGSRLDEVLNKVPFHWKTKATAMSCIRKYIAKGVIKEFKLEKGKLYLK